MSPNTTNNFIVMYCLWFIDKVSRIQIKKPGFNIFYMYASCFLFLHDALLFKVPRCTGKLNVLGNGRQGWGGEGGKREGGYPRMGQQPILG